MYVVLNVLLKDGIMDAERVVANEAYIRHFIAHGKCPFSVWIWGFDAFLDSHPQAAKGYPHVLKALYDKDLAEESEILAHYKSERRAPGFEAAARAAAPFLSWLETADSDEDVTVALVLRYRPVLARYFFGGRHHHYHIAAALALRCRPVLARCVYSAIGGPEIRCSYYHSRCRHGSAPWERRTQAADAS